ncbi:Lumazine-binding protein [Syntrophomonas zehnderi OL-4]|uniref:Riboflavin synthase n=1 Tax=Syntrophomonas zehnderi OL-4 TaxID=690567 RepID=A0A0E4GE77_9FIRM|nr:Lumazine-binding protein [Syntrophomonas zehnderi OL-4]
MIKIFTGIIEELGTIKKIERGTNSSRISVQAEKVLEDVDIGDSIAVNGVCLTVTSFATTHFVADVMAETLAKTNLNELSSGKRVNLERAMRLGDRMGGHLVQGHVDGVGTITEREKLDIAILFTIKAPSEVLAYVVSKGSIAIDGISLTVVDVSSDSFTISLIPHTAAVTTLGFKKPGDTVNLETDIIGRYIEKLITRDKGENKTDLSWGFLAEHGFL